MIKPLFSESHTNKFSRFGDKTNISSENDPAGLRYRLELAVLLFHFIEVNWMALYSSTFGKFRKDVFHPSAL